MAEQLTHWKKTCNPNYLGSWDLVQAGTDQYTKLVLTIKEIKEEEVLDPGTNKNTIETVCHFVENYKPMILNTTNKAAIAKATGSDFIERWVGHQIEIHVEKVKAFGDIWDALRVSKIPVKVAMAKCECCGKEITQKIYDGIKAKYGYGCCCMDCIKKMQEKEATNE